MMFKRLFRKSATDQSVSNAPIEPIFPAESISVAQVDFDEGPGFVMVNQAYNDYPNKTHFAWCVQITIEYQDTNENGLPSEAESHVLNEMEDQIESFIQKDHQTHFIGRVTRKNYRDIIFYTDRPKYEDQSTREFLDRMNELRNLNFRVDRDEEWSFVSGLIRV